MDSSPGQLSNSSACSQTTSRATRRTPTGSITLLRKFCPAVTWSTGGGQQVAQQGPGGLGMSRRRATFAEDRHVIAEEAAVELPERSALADQLVREATLFEREECQEMAEHAGGVSGIGNVVGIEEARQAPVAQEQPGGEPGSRGCPVIERLLEGEGLFEGDPGCANGEVRNPRRTSLEEKRIHPAQRQPQANRDLGRAEMVLRQPHPVAQEGRVRPAGFVLDGGAHIRPLAALLAKPSPVRPGMGGVEGEIRRVRGQCLPHGAEQGGGVRSEKAPRRREVTQRGQSKT